MNLYVISIDHDGCGQFPYVRRCIYEMMLNILISDSSAVFVIINGSARQSNFRNLWTMNHHRPHMKDHSTGNCFRVINKFATLARVDKDEDPAYEAIRVKLQPHQSRIIMDKLLMEDIDKGTPAGTHFTIGLALPEHKDVSQGVYMTTRFSTANIPWCDEGKAVLTSNQISHFLVAHPQVASVNYYFFDDKLMILAKVYANAVRNSSIWPSKLTVNLFNASMDVFSPFGDPIVFTGINNTPLPCTRTGSYELFFKVLTGESNQSNIIRKLIENESFPKSQPPSSSLSAYLSLFVNNPVKWDQLCFLLKDQWPRIFPDSLWKTALQEKNVEALFTISVHMQRNIRFKQSFSLSALKSCVAPYQNKHQFKQDVFDFLQGLKDTSFFVLIMLQLLLRVPIEISPLFFTGHTWSKLGHELTRYFYNLIHVFSMSAFLTIFALGRSSHLVVSPIRAIVTAFTACFPWLQVRSSDQSTVNDDKKKDGLETAGSGSAHGTSMSKLYGLDTPVLNVPNSSVVVYDSQSTPNADDKRDSNPGIFNQLAHS